MSDGSLSCPQHRTRTPRSACRHFVRSRTRLIASRPLTRQPGSRRRRCSSCRTVPGITHRRPRQSVRHADTCNLPCRCSTCRTLRYRISVAGLGRRGVSRRPAAVMLTVISRSVFGMPKGSRPRALRQPATAHGSSARATSRHARLAPTGWRHRTSQAPYGCTAAALGAVAETEKVVSHASSYRRRIKPTPRRRQCGPTRPAGSRSSAGRSAHASARGFNAVGGAHHEARTRQAAATS